MILAYRHRVQGMSAFSWFHRSPLTKLAIGSPKYPKYNDINKPVRLIVNMIHKVVLSFIAIKLRYKLFFNECDHNDFTIGSYSLWRSSCAYSASSNNDSLSDCMHTVWIYSIYLWHYPWSWPYLSLVSVTGNLKVDTHLIDYFGMSRYVLNKYLGLTWIEL